jgi:predicted peptidase
VLLYLHSYDARSQDLQKLKLEGLPFLLRSGTKLPFVVVAPLCPPDEWWDSRWSVENVKTLIDEILEAYRVDSSRVYLTGRSMGGAGSWRLASEHAARFAAIVPLCGRTQLKYVPSLRNTPVWAFHGEKDTIVPPSESQKMIEALQKSGGEAKLSIFLEMGHEIWHLVYNDSNLYDWLLKYSTKESGK